MILFIKNIEIEGPETLGDFFLGKGYPIKVVNLEQGGILPEEVTGLDAVVVLGGPMNVDEEGKYPFLKEEKAFIRKTVEAKIPFLGVCLGSQLLARACGAGVGKSPNKEVGWYPVDLNSQGKKDPLFKGVESCFDVFQWHEDMFSVPESGVLLAGSKLCPHQAFRVGSNAYGLQFHIEITPDCIEDWAGTYFAGKEDRQQRTREMVLGYGKRQEKFQNTANRVYNNFLQMVKNRKVK